MNDLAQVTQSQETFVIQYQELCRLEQQAKAATGAAAQELGKRRQAAESQLAGHATALVQARDVRPDTRRRKK